MIGNSSEHQGMIPGKRDYQFSFSTTDFMKRFGATQNKELKFKGLLERANTPSLANKRVSSMMLWIFIFTNYPAHLKKSFQFRTSDYSLRRTNVLVLPRPKTTTWPQLC